MTAEQATVLAYNQNRCVDFVFSLLIPPIALATLLVIGFRSYKSKQVLQSLPLLAIEVNTLVIWLAMAYFVVQQYYLDGKDVYIVGGKTDSFRYNAVTCFLGTAIWLEPMNLFLYTWRFLETLEREEKN